MPRHAMNPVRWAFLALALLALVAAPTVLRGCSRPTEPAGAGGVGAPTTVPTPSEARATESGTRAEAATRALLGQADAGAVRADSLSALLAAERSRTSTYRVTLASARARLDSALVAGTRLPLPPPEGGVSVDTSRTLGAPSAQPPFEPPSTPPSNLLTLLAAERVAADAAIEHCEARAALSTGVATAQAARATSAYAAADSALAALSYTRLAYVEADRRATSATRLATRRGRLLTVAGGLIVGACAVAILR